MGLREIFDADATPGVGRVFVVCRECKRVAPYYRLYGKRTKGLGCKCGGLFFRPAVIPTWKAIVLIAWGWLSRQGDPRMPIRTVENRFA